LTLQLQQKLTAIPPELSTFKLSIGDEGNTLIYDYDTKAERTGVATLLGELSRAGLRIRDLQTTQSSLEDIFVGLVSDRHPSRTDKR
jgi:ABC-2 type transport system ATP-binding protein